MQLIDRRRFTVAALGALVAGCGGGGGGDGSGGGSPPAGEPGERRTASAASPSGNDYPLQIYLPPVSAAPRAELPMVYALDGESWFEVLITISRSSARPFGVVAIGNQFLRNTDYVPYNNCTPGGGGEATFMRFIREVVTPLVEASHGGHPDRRILFGHSHGGSFVFAAMFAQSPDQHHFSTYLPVDASIGCMLGPAYGWESTYFTNHGARLPVRLHMSWATGGNIAANIPYAQHIEARRYAGLVMATRQYEGTHNGVVPAALADGLAFALA